jgi:hypothetical protein
MAGPVEQEEDHFAALAEANLGETNKVAEEYRIYFDEN